MTRTGLLAVKLKIASEPTAWSWDLLLRRQPQREQPNRRKCQTFTRRAEAGLGGLKVDRGPRLPPRDGLPSGSF